ncbi:MAG TPA: cytochrome c biogenesis protein CcdA [Polyangiales bacterium]|jgi:thiol:disulfide interchange protein DsbD|nr:cytochrome c biogenesis protein CcdA [Polyangiales bacterium]
MRRIHSLFRVVAPAACAALALAFASQARADVLGDLEKPFSAALQSGSFAYALVLIFAAGLATSLTPCVYPMIAITVSVFGARSAQSRREAALLSTVFVLGIAALFTPLGLFAATTGGVFGAALASPIVLVGLAVLFLALAASMFGAFDLDLPAGLKNRLATMGGVGYRGAFLIGVACALIAAPCTGPVLGFLLTWVGTTGNVAFGGVALFVYALGLGLLFWVVGTFSVSLPKSGQWLEWVKSVFGIVMIVAAIYYLRDLIPGLTDLAKRTTPFLVGAVVLLVVGLAIGAVHLSFHDPSIAARARKTAGITAAVVGLCGMIGYLQALPEGARIAWGEDYTAALAQAKAQNKPLLVDFSASWCGACQELEHKTFSDPRIVREGSRFIPVRVDLSPGKDTPEKKQILASYQQHGLPLVVLHKGTGEAAARVTSFVEADQFLNVMKGVR